MTAPEDDSRPLSVAELLARNGTIGAPPISARRRRKRRNSDGVSVAELTGEIPVVRTGEIPVVPDEGYADEDYLDEDGEEYLDDDGYSEEGAGGYAGGDSAADYVATEYVATEYDATEYEATEYDTTGYVGEATESAVVVPDSSEMVIRYTATEESVPLELPGYGVAEEPVGDPTDTGGVEDAVVEPEAPPRSNDPLPPRGRGPELSHDPRPARRTSDAEQMAYDPVDESVSLADLVEEHAVDAEALRSYLRASEGALFSGDTVADDLARRGFAADPGDGTADDDDGDPDDEADEVAAPAGRAPRDFAGNLGSGVLAVLQSLLAVVFGAGLFIAFDQLWRWNNLVALVLTVIVVVALAGAVRMLRKTEDIVSTLTAVAVGLLVTLGPLALQN